MGDLVTIQSSLMTRIADYFSDFMTLTVTPVVLLALTVAIGFILDQDWYAALAALGCLIVLTFPYPYFIGKHMESLRSTVTRFTEGRMELIHEVFSSIVAVKFYTWEPQFRNWVRTWRNGEAASMNRLNMSAFTLRSLEQITPLVTSLVAIFVHVIVSPLGVRVLTPSKAFSLIATLALSEKALADLWIAIKDFSEARVAFPRMDEFLALKEAIDAREFSTSGSPFVEVRGSFNWFDVEFDNTKLIETDDPRADRARIEVFAINDINVLFPFPLLSVFGRCKNDILIFLDCFA